MAHVTWTFFIEKLTGKIDDRIAQTWKGIAYVRKRWRVNMKKRTAAQKANCETFGSLSTRWKELSDNSRQTWIRYARKAGMSGYNAFISENQKRSIDGKPYITDAPEGALPGKKKNRR